jgi:hypothetical protein
MNNLEFRYFDSLGKFFQYSSQFDWPDNFSKLEKFFSMACRYSNGVVQQYTGLTDSTGKKIFEGDIVDYRYDGMSKFEKERYSNLLVSPVYWEYERWRIKYSAESYAWHLMKVIGNIFETPELLKL